MDHRPAAGEVYRQLRHGPPGRVVAAWADGTVTLEEAAFTGYERPDGGVTAPLALFPTGQPQTLAAILRHLRAAAWRQRPAGPTARPSPD